MSDRIPTFSVGDRVRIMQTTRMEELGLAGRIGTIGAISLGVAQKDLAVIMLANETVRVPLDSLMHEPLDPYIRHWNPHHPSLPENQPKKQP